MFEQNIARSTCRGPSWRYNKHLNGAQSKLKREKKNKLKEQNNKRNNRESLLRPAISCISLWMNINTKCVLIHLLYYTFWYTEYLNLKWVNLFLMNFAEFMQCNTTPICNIIYMYTSEWFCVSVDRTRSNNMYHYWWRSASPTLCVFLIAAISMPWPLFSVE